MAKPKSGAKRSKGMPFRTGMVALCDYASKGERNKHTLVNVYSGDVIVGSFPAQLHFGFYAEIFPEGDAAGPVTISVIYGPEKLGEFTVEFADHVPGRPAVILMQALGFTAQKPGAIEFLASADGHDPTSLLNKQVKLGTINQPSASQPPS